MQKKFKLLLYFSITYIIITIIFALCISSSLHLMMGFNMFLAIIPFYITMNFEKYDNINNTIFLIIFIIWLLFFPNTFYFLTDLIHITKIDIYYYNNVDGDTVMVYYENIVEWLKVVHLMFGAIGGTLLGLSSLYQMQQMLKKRKVKYIYSIINIIIILSSLGIYIGRFLRFNSWDIFNPYIIIKTLLLRFNIFTLLFIILFSIIIAVLYYPFNYFISNNNIEG